MGPVSSVETGPFLIEIEALSELDAGGGFSRIDEEGAFYRQLNRDGLTSGNVEDVIFVGRFRLSDFNKGNALDQIFRGTSHGCASREEREGNGEGREIWRV